MGRVTRAFLLLAGAGAIMTPQVGAQSWRGPRVVLSPAILAALPKELAMICQIRPKPHWTPTTSQLQAAEVALAQVLPKWASTYGRQYLGLTIGGRKILQVRGFCRDYYQDDPKRSWERIPLHLLDAGTCAFTVNYDIGTHTLAELEWGT